MVICALVILARLCSFEGSAMTSPQKESPSDKPSAVRKFTTASKSDKKFTSNDQNIGSRKIDSGPVSQSTKIKNSIDEISENGESKTVRVSKKFTTNSTSVTGSKNQESLGIKAEDKGKTEKTGVDQIQKPKAKHKSKHKPGKTGTTVTKETKEAEKSKITEIDKSEEKTRNLKVNTIREPFKKPTVKDASIEAEITQLKIRFPDLTWSTDPKTKYTMIEFKLPIVDPDFPYDLPFAHLRCNLPPHYPLFHESGPFPTFDLLNDEIPPKYRDTVAKHMNSYSRTFKGGELILRPMIKYLEKNFETFLTEKAAVHRFKFFPPTQTPPITSSDEKILVKEESKLSPSDDITLEVTNTLREFGIIEDTGEHFGIDEDFISFSNESSEKGEGKSEENIEKYLADNQFMNPIMIKLGGDGGQSNVRGGETYTINLQTPKLSNIALVYGTLIGFTVKCGRCQAINAIKELRPWVDRFETCHKCSTKIPLIYEPKLVTGTSNTLGAVRIANKGIPMDILPCRMQIVCLNCSGEEDNPPAIQVPIYSGEIISSKFPKCYHPFSLSLGQVSFIQAGKILKLVHKKKKNLQSGITIGQPLPQSGACSHYSKSFRWYRFPCCGRTFPCDDCHDEAIKRGEEEPHETERAIRFLCGWCAREQSIATCKKCECGADWSKGAGPSRTTHWEGGRGMRARTTMSRKDTHKYKGLSK